jgi:RNA 3'-terminal phosphate cyclase (ATP)
VRFGVALAAVLGRPLRITNARARRRQPGLRAQHVAAVRACAELCGGSVRGAEVGSREFSFAPGGRPRGGSYRFEIGTAGSAPMLALAVLPVACRADGPVVATIRGGTFQDFAPSAHHLEHVLLPTLAAMGIEAALELRRPGYPPDAVGELRLHVRPVRGAIAPLVRCDAGRVESVEGIALASHLAERRVAARMADACCAALAAGGLDARIRCVEDETALRPGASLAVWASTTSGARIGADRAGARGRSSEAIGRFVARALIDDLASGAATDRHLADQLVVFAALATGTSRFSVPSATEHVLCHVWLVTRFGARARCDGRGVEVEGLGRDLA